MERPSPLWGKMGGKFWKSSLHSVLSSKLSNYHHILWKYGSSIPYTYRHESSRHHCLLHFASDCSEADDHYRQIMPPPSNLLFLSSPLSLGSSHPIINEKNWAGDPFHLTPANGWASLPCACLPESACLPPMKRSTGGTQDPPIYPSLHTAAAAAASLSPASSSCSFLS